MSKIRNMELTPLNDTNVAIQSNTTSFRRKDDADKVRPLVEEDDNLIDRIRDWTPPEPLPEPPNPHEWIRKNFDLMPPRIDLHQYEDECYALSGSCAECLEMKFCGWCGNEQTCLVRDVLSPLHLGINDDCGSSWIEHAERCPPSHEFPKVEFPKNLAIDHTPMRRGPGEVVDSGCVGFQGTEGDCERAKADGTMSRVRQEILPQSGSRKKESYVVFEYEARESSLFTYS